MIARKVTRRTIIITGGTKGIGKAIAQLLAKENCNLFLIYHTNHAAAKITLNECLEVNSQVFLLNADVSVESQVQYLFGQVLQQAPSIDVVINNAGLNIDKPILDLTESDWDRVVDINMKGTFLVSKEAAKYMINQEMGGIIINVSATTAIKGRKNGINYCASKAGVIAMTKCLAMELGPMIRVNCVIPGFTWTEETVERFDLEKRLDEELAQRKIPLGRMAHPDEIAKTVRFLISPDAAYINGQKIIIDGGEFMY